MRGLSQMPLRPRPDSGVGRPCERPFSVVVVVARPAEMQTAEDKTVKQRGPQRGPPQSIVRQLAVATSAMRPCSRLSACLQPAVCHAAIIRNVSDIPTRLLKQQLTAVPLRRPLIISVVVSPGASAIKEARPLPP